MTDHSGGLENKEDEEGSRSEIISHTLEFSEEEKEERELRDRLERATELIGGILAHKISLEGYGKERKNKEMREKRRSELFHNFTHIGKMDELYKKAEENNLITAEQHVRLSEIMEIQYKYLPKITAREIKKLEEFDLPDEAIEGLRQLLNKSLERRYNEYPLVTRKYESPLDITNDDVQESIDYIKKLIEEII